MNFHYDIEAMFGRQVLITENCDGFTVFSYAQDTEFCTMTVAEIFPNFYLFFNEVSKAPTRKQLSFFPDLAFLEYCLSGIYELTLESREKVYISEGDLLFHYMGEKVISAKVISDDPYIGVSFLIDITKDHQELKDCLQYFGMDYDTVIGLFTNLDNINVVRPSYELKQLFNSLLLTNITNKRQYYRIKTIEILSLLMDENKTAEVSVSFQDNLVEQVVDCMTDDLARQITISKLAHEHGVSVTTINQYFKNKYQETPYHFLRRKRLEEAAKLLKVTALSVTEIAAAVGFTNPSKFACAFKEMFRYCPSEYRKKYFRS